MVIVFSLVCEDTASSLPHIYEDMAIVFSPICEDTASDLTVYED